MESGTGKTGTGKKVAIVLTIGALIATFSYYFLIYKPKADALKKAADAKAAALAAGKTNPSGTVKKPAASSPNSHPANTNVGINTGTSGDSFDPTPYTDAIYKDLFPASSFTPRSSDSYLSAMELSDGQLVQVYNDWIDRYTDASQGNMVDAMNNASTLWNYEWTQNTKALVDRLNTL